MRGSTRLRELQLQQLDEQCVHARARSLEPCMVAAVDLPELAEASAAVPGPLDFQASAACGTPGIERDPACCLRGQMDTVALV